MRQEKMRYALRENKRGSELQQLQHTKICLYLQATNRLRKCLSMVDWPLKVVVAVGGWVSITVVDTLIAISWRLCSLYLDRRTLDVEASVAI